MEFGSRQVLFGVFVLRNGRGRRGEWKRESREELSK
jgi:hypothetical protein